METEDWPAAWAMVSSTPSACLGLQDRGTLCPGQRADFVIIDSTTKRIGATFVAGRPSHLSGWIAERLMGTARTV